MTAVLGMMSSGRSCGVSELEQGLCSVQGTASHQVALLEQRRAPRQHNPGCSTGLLLGSLQPPPWAGQDQCAQGETQPASLGASPRAVQQQESLGCLSVGDTKLGDVPPRAWGHLSVTAGTVLAVAKAGLGMASPGP